MSVPENPTTRSIYQDLQHVQKEVESITTNKENPHFKSKYATLVHVCETMYPILHKHGFVVSQPMAGKSLITRLFHLPTGESITSEAVLEYKPEDPQKQGSAITYLRRTSLLSTCGIPLNDGTDNDGNSRNKKKPIDTATKYGMADRALKNEYVNMCKRINGAKQVVEDYKKKNGVRDSKDLGNKELKDLLELLRVIDT